MIKYVFGLLTLQVRISLCSKLWSNLVSQLYRCVDLVILTNASHDSIVVVYTIRHISALKLVEKRIWNIK